MACQQRVLMRVSKVSVVRSVGRASDEESETRRAEQSGEKKRLQGHRRGASVGSQQGSLTEQVGKAACVAKSIGRKNEASWAEWHKTSAGEASAGASVAAPGASAGA